MSVVTQQLKARDVMSTDPVCISPSASIREVARIFEEHEISGVPVLDPQGRVCGIVTKTDLIRRCCQGTDEIPPAYLFEILAEQGDTESSEVIPEPLICAEDFMTEDPLMVGPDITAGGVAALLVEKRIHRAIVVDEDRFPLGIVTSMDLLAVFPAA